MKFEFKHYKHYLLAFAVVFVATQVCVAQIEFTEHTIAGNFDRAVSVYAEDIDGDGDMDVLGASPSAGDITWWESDLNPGRILRGCVFDAENDSLLEGVEVATSHGFSTQSDTAGFWCLERVGSDSFNITFSKSGYNDSTLIDQHVEYEDTLEINIGLLHPELLLSEAEIVDELEYGGSAEHNLTIQNDGNGPLEWSVKPRLVGESCVDPWEMRQSQVIGNTLEDSRLQGVVFINDQYYVSGGGNDTNMIYVLDREGHEVDRFAQPGDSRYGMKDLAWDGELIWGCSDNMVIGFNTEGDSVTAFEGPEYDLSAIAWDSDREVFWVGRKTGRGIYGCDIEGNCQDTLSRCDLRLYGLAYWQDDPDGYNLYILHCPDNETQVVHKMNTETGDTMFVALLEPEEGGSPGGAFITNTYYPRCWVFVNITNDPDGDRIDIWQVDGNTSWMTLEPMTGDIESQASQDLTLSIFTEGLLAPDWEAELVFSHNAAGLETILPVTLTIRPDAVRKNDNASILNEFGITSVYPNPFNSTTTIRYSLPTRSNINLNIYNTRGQLVDVLLDRVMPAGRHSVVWDGGDLSSGLYFVKLEGPGQSLTQKIMLLK